MFSRFPIFFEYERNPTFGSKRCFVMLISSCLPKCITLNRKTAKWIYLISVEMGILLFSVYSFVIVCYLFSVVATEARPLVKSDVTASLPGKDSPIHGCTYRTTIKIHLLSEYFLYLTFCYSLTIQIIIGENNRVLVIKLYSV